MCDQLFLDLHGQDGRQPLVGWLLRLLLDLLDFGLFFECFVLPLGVLVEVAPCGERLGALAAGKAFSVGAVSASHL